MKILNNTNVDGQLTILTGSATTPSLSVVNDTNTGIFFPAADTIALAEGGVEVLRVNSNANVGIGTQTPSEKLEVIGNTSISGVSFFGSTNRIYQSTTAGSINYYRIATASITSSFKQCTFRATAATPSGTITEVLVGVNLAFRSDVGTASQQSSMIVNTSHSFNSDTTAENGFVIRIIRISHDATNAYIDLYINKSSICTINVQPLTVNDWNWSTGSLAAGPAAGTFRSSTVTTVAGFAGTNINASFSTGATYSTHGVLGGRTLSNSSNKTGQWAYFGMAVFDFNASYLAGRALNVMVALQEQSFQGTPTLQNLDEITLNIKANLDAHTDANDFNTKIPTFSMDIYGRTSLTNDDFAALIFSTGTGSKVIRFYIKLKSNNTLYRINQYQRYGTSYLNSTFSTTTDFSYFTFVSDSAMLSSLPTPAQGSIVYGTKVLTTTTASAFFGTGSIWTSNNDGIDSGLDADLLDGQHGTYYLDYNNLNNKPTISNVSITVVGNEGLTGSGSFTLNQSTTASITVSHADTSNVANITTASSVFINGLSFDTYGHVLTVTTASQVVNNGTLTLTVSGIGLSGTSSFTANQSENSTFTVTSNATSSNVVSTIVSRDTLGAANVSTIYVSTGSTTIPSISMANDTNTGIYFPTADTIGFVEGGVEAMRINSSGYVGIGTQTPSELLHLYATTNAGIIAEDANSIIRFITAGGINYFQSAAAFSGGSTADLYFTGMYASPVNMVIKATTGNIGIGGVTAPSQKLEVSGVVSATSFISTVASGTAPFTVSSTTSVVNLNADLLDGQHSTYFIQRDIGSLVYSYRNFGGAL